ncbi:hypothetical protein RB200_42040 [Streptomyces sp. PmtG]
MSGSQTGEPAPRVAAAAQDEAAGPGAARLEALAVGEDEAAGAGARGAAPAVLEAADDESA